MADPNYRNALLEALKALRFYADPKKWSHSNCAEEGCILEYGEAPAQDAMLKVAQMIAPTDMCCAPWTEDQVRSLNAFQESVVFHPFTYGDDDEKVDLIATPDGWVEYDGGPVVQVWAHPWMANWSWSTHSNFPG
jgi:hypothetical protein